MPVLFLSEADVRRLADFPRAVERVEAGFRKLALDEAENRPRQRVRTDQVMLHVLAAGGKTLPALGLKAYTTTAKGARFHVMLYHAKTGELLALIEADYLGQVRTGAASAVATKHLARPEADTLAVIGTGKQARAQVLAIATVRSLKSVRVFGRDAEKAKAFAESLAAESGLSVAASAAAEEAVRGAGIVCTATSSRTAVISGEWLSDGCHVNLVGSNYLATRETDAETFRRAALVTVDRVDQAMLEAGDFTEAMDRKFLSWPKVIELERVVAGRAPGRTDDGAITVFKSLGVGIEDVAVGAELMGRAKAAGAGLVLPIPGGYDG